LLGRRNISPRGANAFRVLDCNTFAYLNETGSGNETAADLRSDGAWLTIMFCGFKTVPMSWAAVDCQNGSNRLHALGTRSSRGAGECDGEVDRGRYAGVSAVVSARDDACRQDP
jgi:hypothetical protein